MKIPDDFTDKDIENPVVQCMLFNALFKQVEECDSKKVDDFWAEMSESMVLYAFRNKSG